MIPELQYLATDLDAQQTEILSVLDGLTESQLSYQPDKDTWCLIEQLDHLTRTEREAAKMVSSPALVARLAKDF